MQATVEPGHISGTLAAPPSKSMTQRAYAAALLHKGTTVITNAGSSADEMAALNIIRQSGAEIKNDTGSIEILSNGIKLASNSIHCGESGLAARLFIPIAATQDGTIEITGEGSLLRRPMEGLADVFAQLGVSLSGFNGRLPFSVQGPMQAKSISMNASGGSQLLSGLLFALANIATGPLAIEADSLTSRPYIDMTLAMLQHFGRPVTHGNYKIFKIDPAAFTHSATIGVDIEGDWSSAAAWLVAGATAGDITIDHLNPTSLQADRAVLEVLRGAGAAVTVSAGSVTVKKSPLRAFEFDATDSPDLFPILAIFAAACRGESCIRGVRRLFNKESNRAESISEMLQNFDVPFSIDNDELYVTGARQMSGTVIDTYGDHRIVMAAAIGALRARSRVDIPDAGCVSKSYPGFFKDLHLCGGKVNISNNNA